MIDADLVLAGALVHDGTGAPARVADVAILDDRVVAVGPGIIRAIGEGPERVDLAGLHLAPGFIDMHSHSDVAVIAEPLNAPKTRQGITTELIGQDGLGVAPFDPLRDADWRRSLLGLTGHPDVPWTWRSFEDHLAAVAKAAPATNVAALLAYGTVRNAVVGLDDRPASEAELDHLSDLVEDAMAAGAFGLSIGLVYLPAVFAGRAELVRACRVVGRRGGRMVVHLRSQGDAWHEAIDEAITIAREAEVALHVSHLCALGGRNWPKIPGTLERLAMARETGLAVTFDQHPYTGASTVLSQVLPPWVAEGGPEQMRQRLGRRAVRDRVRTEIAGPGRSGWENYAGLAGWDRVQIAGAQLPEHARYLGRTIGAIASEDGRDPLDVTADLLAAEEGSVAMVLLDLYDDAGILRILNEPGGTIGTDGVIAAQPHPRLYGTTARVLGRYVRELGGMPLEAAVRRLGAAGADALGLVERGRIEAGAFADLVVFDPASVTDRATYADPRRHPDGIRHVIVNGRFVVRDERVTGERPGRVLRAGRGR